jgi:uncharacterized membrane protein YqiK
MSGHSGHGSKQAQKEQEGAKAMAEYEAAGRAVREKTARLRALRMAKEAAEPKAAVKTSTKQPGKSTAAAPRKKGAKAAEKKASLAEWLKGEREDGRGG